MKRNNTRLYLVALLLFLGGAGYLLCTGIAGNSTYFLDVAEAMAMPAEELRAVRLCGTVRPDTISRPDGVLGVAFVLADLNDPSRGVRVSYRGAVPDAFKPGCEVIVEGGIQPDNSFALHSLSTNCPSKYKKENRT
jgi:cytochrome c-type biogenesis protein CcmE